MSRFEIENNSYSRLRVKLWSKIPSYITKLLKKALKRFLRKLLFDILEIHRSSRGMAIPFPSFSFPSCSCGSVAPSLHHSITPSLPVRHLETGGGGASIWKSRKECSSEKLNLTPTGDLCGRCLSWASLAIVQESIPWALVDPTRVIERSAEIKPENR